MRKINTFFTADLHLGHTNIIEYCNRPFATIEEMDHALIQNWNNVVGIDDTVYMQGDLTLGANAHSYMKQLNGRIKVISPDWHHDKQWLAKRNSIVGTGDNCKYLWDILERPPVYYGAEHATEIEKVWLHLSHYPLAEWDRKHYGALHLHGHSHAKLELTNTPWLTYRLDIGVDSAREYLGEYRPFSFEEVIRIMQGQYFDQGQQEWCADDAYQKARERWEDVPWCSEIVWDKYAPTVQIDSEWDDPFEVDSEGKGWQ